MLEQSIETLTQPTATQIPLTQPTATEISLTQPVEPAIPEATETETATATPPESTEIPHPTGTSISVSVQDKQTALINQAIESGFNIEIVKYRMPADMCNSCMILDSDMLVSPAPGEEATIQIDKLVIDPRRYLTYERLELTPGSSDTSQEVTYAFDGIAEVEGIEYTTEEYLEKVRKKFPNARWLKRGAIVGRYISSEPTKSSTIVPLSPKDLVQVYLSPSSVRSFQALVMRMELNAKDGIPRGNYLELTKTKKRSNKNTWTQFAFKDVDMDTEASSTNLISNS